MGLNLKVSVITVCFNSERYIEKTIESVKKQTYSNIEYIIVDGKSTDNTTKIIYNNKRFVSKIISEKDNGIYDAMNKGIKNATGDLIYFLNSGDFFFNDSVVEHIIQSINQNNDCDIIYGDWIYYDNNSIKLNTGFRRDKYEIIWKGINHQAIFTRRSVFEESGLFNLRFEIFGDYDWLLQSILKRKYKLMYVGYPLVYYLWGGKSMISGTKYIHEKYAIMNKYLSLKDFIWFAISCPIGMGQYFKGMMIGFLGSK